MQPIDLFSEKEKKLRKHWRIALFVILGFELFSSFFAGLNFPNPAPVILGISLFLIAIYGALYYLAYHRQSARFLIAFLLFPLMNLPKRIEGYRTAFDSAAPGETTAMLIFLGITLAIYGWWYFLSFRLYEIHFGFAPSRACRKGIKEMNQTANFDALSSKYEALLSGHSRFRPAIELAYQNKKSTLKVQVVAE